MHARRSHASVFEFVSVVSTVSYTVSLAFVTRDTAHARIQRATPGLTRVSYRLAILLIPIPISILYPYYCIMYHLLLYATEHYFLLYTTIHTHTVPDRDIGYVGEWSRSGWSRCEVVSTTLTPTASIEY